MTFLKREVVLLNLFEFKSFLGEYFLFSGEIEGIYIFLFFRELFSLFNKFFTFAFFF
jgi:hypothetical protein